MRALFVLCLGLAACSQSESGGETDSDVLSGPEVAATETEVTLSDDDLLRVCRGGASFRNGTDVNAIQAHLGDENLVRISYARDDGKFFAYDCKVEGSQVRYRMIDESGPGTGPGNWSGRASKTTFEIFPGGIEFSDDFFDGSSDTDRIEI